MDYHASQQHLPSRLLSVMFGMAPLVSELILVALGAYLFGDRFARLTTPATVEAGKGGRPPEESP